MDIFTVVITQPDGIDKSIYSEIRLEKAIDKVESMYKELHETEFKVEIRDLSLDLEERSYHSICHEDGTRYEILESHID